MTTPTLPNLRAAQDAIRTSAPQDVSELLTDCLESIVDCCEVCPHANVVLAEQVGASVLRAAQKGRWMDAVVSGMNGYESIRSGLMGGR